MNFDSIKNVLFDLDGTLTDSKPGIIKSIRYSLDRMGVTAPPDMDLDWCLGPPLHNSFHVLLPGAGEKQVNQAVDFYRERYVKIGMFESDLYPGIKEMLEDLASAEFKIYLATSKPWVYAEKILEHFKINGFFAKAFGSELGGALSDKKELLADILKRIGALSNSCLMIGDRKHDLIGATHNKIPAMGVLWGYGSREELSAQPNLGLLNNSSELCEILLSEEKVANA